MRETTILAAALGAVSLVASALACGSARAQEATFSDSSGPTVDDYLKEAGPDAKLVPQGSLKIGGKSVNCGKRPTVLNSNFDSWGGAFPGFVILNTKRIKPLSTTVQMYIYSHECGHQFEGPDETKADLFAIRRGVKWGWLDATGMEEICIFISTLKGDAVHPPGPQRCDTMRKYYQQLIENDASQTAAAPAAPASAKPKPAALAPQQ